MTTVWIGRCGGVVRHGSLRQPQGRLTMNVNGGPGAGVPGDWGWKRAVREPPLRAMGTARTGANVNLGGRVAVGCVVRHGPPGTAPRLTTNGWAARGWVARGRGRSETGPHVRQDGRRGSCRGGLGATGVGWELRGGVSTRPSEYAGPAHHERLEAATVGLRPEDGRVGDAATGKGRVERAEELERTGNRRPIGDAAPTRERMRRGGG